MRKPDMVIGGRERPYLLRWYVIPRNPVFNVYLHQFLRSDDDRALHDHPWMNLSVLLKGRYREHTQGGHRDFKAGQFRFRWTGRIAHRIELTHGPVWTLFVTGPRYRQWGFLCPQGWRHWKDFVSMNDSGQVGPGCD